MNKLNGTQAPPPQSPRLAISLSTTKIQPHSRATVQSAKSSLGGAPLPNVQQFKGFRVSRNFNLTPTPLGGPRYDSQSGPIRIDAKKVQNHTNNGKGRVISQLNGSSFQVSNTPLASTPILPTNAPVSQHSNSSLATHLQFSKIKQSPSFNLLQNAFHKNYVKNNSSVSQTDLLKLPQRPIQKVLSEHMRLQENTPMSRTKEEPTLNPISKKTHNIVFKQKLSLPENRKVVPSCITPITEPQRQKQIIQFPLRANKNDNQTDPLKLPVFKYTPTNLASKAYFKKSVVPELGASLIEQLQVKNSSASVTLSQLEHIEVIN